MPPRIHHFGLIVTEIEDYLRASPWGLEGEIVEDPIQKARLCMVKMAGDDTALVELVQPLEPSSPTWNAAQRGGGWHHVCFLADGRDEADGMIKEYRWLPVTDWQPAALFSCRMIRFCYTRNKGLVEFLLDERA